MENLLIVEDEPKLAEAMQSELTKYYNVLLASDGREALLKFNRSINLVLLDLKVPYINGFELCETFRKDSPQLPIIVITAYGDIDSKIKAFELGADDYIVKPFHYSELLAKIKVFLRRSKNNVSNNISEINIQDLTIYPKQKKVERGGKEINLTQKEYQLLEVLAMRKGEVIKKDDLLVEVWGKRVSNNNNTVEVYINFLRNKIDKDFDIKLIQTRTGLGYYIKD